MSNFGCCRECGTAWNTGDSWEGDRAIGNACPGCTVREYRRALRELRTWLESDPEYCPLCRANFSRLGAHEPTCTLANLEPYPNDPLGG